MIKVFCFYLLLISSVCYSQNNGRIIYRVNSEKLEYEEHNSARNTFVKVMNNLSKIRDSVSLYLDFNDFVSTFYVDEKTNIGLSNKKGYKSIINSFKKYYRDDRVQIKIKVVDMDKIYNVQSKTTDLVWQISNEKKKIGNYDCIKAITQVEDKISTRGVYNKLVEAWFAPEVPIRLGPNNYGGLPGLIMELKEGKFTYYVKNIYINPNFDIKIEKPNGKTITQKEYFDRIPSITRDNVKEYLGN